MKNHNNPLFCDIETCICETSDVNTETTIPTMFFIDESGNKEIVYGSRPYDFYEVAILKLNPKIIKSEYNKSWETLFSKYPTLTAKEFSELSGTPRDESEQELNDLVVKGHLEKHTTKNGSIWIMKDISR